MGDLGQWFQSIPPLTRTWFGATIGISLLARFGLLNPHWLILQYEPLMHNFQIWRALTSVFYYPLVPPYGFHFLINCYFLYNYSLRLETGLFNGRPADYLFMLLFNWICFVIVALLINSPFLMDFMIMSVLYVWCQVNKDTIVSFWFGTQFKAMYLPWVLLLFNFITTGGINDLIGILVGHLYFFLNFKYPQDFGGARLLHTPQFLYHYFPNQRGGTAGFGSAPTPRGGVGGGAGGGGGGGGGGLFRGQGHTLN
ncbi:derlin-1 isoform X1 [Palaemon carinicauda]|uniref:derlin-1 isoform X1 n=1 Tax=Palaemon carinicauda TaxID=392227 RepID=UPI0035B589DC